MSFFIDMVSLIGTAASIAGVSVKDFLAKPPAANADRTEIEKYIRFLEGREVLFAGIDEEVQTAVVRSLEQIKQKTEELRVGCTDEQVLTMLLTLLLTMSKELRRLHGIDTSTAQGKYSMYLALQGVRFEIARVLAVLCAAFKIDPQNPRMRKFILNFAVRPRR
jgi:hypothetical protein